MLRFSSTTPVPAFILTGFLGAGKTTLLNRILARAAGKRIAVIENEVGEHNIDGELLTGPIKRLVELANGCLCCTVQGQLAGALLELAAYPDQYDMLIVEASGVADPLPVIRAFQAHHVRDAFRIQALITLVDAANADNSAAIREWQLQVRHADHLILNKTDLVTPDVLDRLEHELRAANPRAAILRAVRADSAATVIDTLSEPLQTATPPNIPHDQHDHQHDGHGFTSVALSADRDIDAERLESWLQAISTVSSMQLLRVKGVLALVGEQRRYVISGVQRLLDGHLDRPWTGQRRSRVVLIGINLNETALRADFQACQVTEPEASDARRVVGRSAAGRDRATRHRT